MVAAVAEIEIDRSQSVEAGNHFEILSAVVEIRLAVSRHYSGSQYSEVAVLAGPQDCRTSLLRPAADSLDCSLYTAVVEHSGLAYRRKEKKHCFLRAPSGAALLLLYLA